jgi:hypothetical protein
MGKLATPLNRFDGPLPATLFHRLESKAAGAAVGIAQTSGFSSRSVSPRLMEHFLIARDAQRTSRLDEKLYRSVTVAAQSKLVCCWATGTPLKLPGF